VDGTEIPGHYPIWRVILLNDDDDGGEHTEEIEVCGTCVPKHSSFRARADVPGWPCHAVRQLRLLDEFPPEIAAVIDEGRCHPERRTPRPERPTSEEPPG